MEHSSRGFTLIELLIVIVIFGILACLGIGKLQEIRATHADAKVVEHAAILANYLEDYAVDHDGQYPGSVEDVLFNEDRPPNVLSYRKNPFSGKYSPPKDGRPSDPGQIGYGLLRNGEGKVSGYVIYVVDHAGVIQEEHYPRDGNGSSVAPASTVDPKDLI